MTHPTEHRTPARLTASPHGHAREGSARPRLPPAPGGPWGRPTLVTPSPTAGARELSPSSGVSCGEKTSPSAARTGAGGGWQGSVGSPLGQADLISQQPFPWEPATTIHTLGNAGKGGQGSAGRGAWAGERGQRAVPQPRAAALLPAAPGRGLLGWGGCHPGVRGHRDREVTVCKPQSPPPPPQARARLGSASSQPPRMVFAPPPRTGGGGLQCQPQGQQRADGSPAVSFSAGMARRSRTTSVLSLGISQEGLGGNCLHPCPSPAHPHPLPGARRTGTDNTPVPQNTLPDALATLQVIPSCLSIPGPRVPPRLRGVAWVPHRLLHPLTPPTLQLCPKPMPILLRAGSGWCNVCR